MRLLALSSASPLLSVKKERGNAAAKSGKMSKSAA
jgi:hypothetical protein